MLWEGHRHSPSEGRVSSPSQSEGPRGNREQGLPEPHCFPLKWVIKATGEDGGQPGCCRVHWHASPPSSEPSAPVPGRPECRSASFQASGGTSEKLWEEPCQRPASAAPRPHSTRFHPHYTGGKHSPGAEADAHEAPEVGGVVAALRAGPRPLLSTGQSSHQVIH